MADERSIAVRSGPARLRIALGVSIAAAALLRFWALAHSVPFSVGIDEPEVMERAVRMIKTGDFNPHFFDYPSLYMYVQAAVGVLRFVAGAIQGEWARLAAATTGDFYIWGRAVTATLGTATVWIVFRAGLRWGPRVAVLAAALMAVMPLHVRESHYVLTDVPMTFLVAATLLLSLRAHEERTLRWFVFAGIAAGLAAATKYNGGLALMLPLIACALTPGLRFARPAVAAWIVVGALAGFLAGAPYTVLDLPTFLNQFARLSSQYRAPANTSEPIWLIYLKMLRIALEWPGYPWSIGPVSLLAIGGCVAALWRAVRDPQRLRWLLALIFPLVYFQTIAGQNIYFGRYLLPLVPFLCLVMAAGMVAFVRLMRGLGINRALRETIAIAVTLTAIASPAYTAIRFDADESKTWTTEEAYRWFLSRVPAGAKVEMECAQFRLPDSYQTRYVKQLRWDGHKTYAGSDLDYLVASSLCYGPYYRQPTDDAEAYAAYEHIFSQGDEVARFQPSTVHPGPELRVFKVRR